MREQDESVNLALVLHGSWSDGLFFAGSILDDTRRSGLHLDAGDVACVVRGGKVEGVAVAERGIIVSVRSLTLVRRPRLDALLPHLQRASLQARTRSLP